MALTEPRRMPPAAGAAGIPATARLAHRRLAGAGEEFLAFAARRPENLRGASYPSLRETSEFNLYALQPWPLFVDSAAVAEMESASVGLADLVRSIPERFFDNDPVQLQRRYRLDEPRAHVLADLLRDRLHLASLVGRGDFIRGRQGWHCLELNMTSYLGGWESSLWSARQRAVPVVAEFLSTRNEAYVCRDPVRGFLRHVADYALERGLADGELNVVFAIPPGEGRGEEVERFGGEIWCELLAERQVERGELMVVTPAEVGVEDDRLAVRGRRAHVLVEYMGGDVTPEIFRCQTLGTACVFNGPLTGILSDNRNLALLSENLDTSLFSDAERSLLRAALPWTRELEQRTTTYRGKRGPLPRLAVEQQRRMVLKRAFSARGEEVYIGRHLSPGAWSETLRAALEDERGWILQEHVSSMPFLFPVVDGGVEPHDVVWGLFTFGSRYCGGYLRAQPSSARGIVNSAQGASNGSFLEVVAEED